MYEMKKGNLITGDSQCMRLPVLILKTTTSVFYLNRFLMLSKIDFLSALSALKFSHSLNFFTSSFSSLFSVLGM